MRRGKSYSDFLSQEDRLQKQCITLLEYQYPELIWYHSPSEGKRTRFEQFKFNYLGGKRKAGFPDIVIFNPITGHELNNRGLAVELKVIYANGKKNYPSTAQKKWLADLAATSWRSEVVYTFEDFQRLLKECYG